MNRMVDLLERLLLSAAEHAVPMREIKPHVQKGPPPAVVNALNRLNHARRIASRRKDARALRELDVARAEYLRLSHEHHRKAAERKLSKLNANGQVNWKQLNSLLRAEAFPATAVSSKLDKLANSPAEALNTLASDFANTCPLPADKNDPPEYMLAAIDAAVQTPSPEDDMFEVKSVATACKNIKKLNAAPGSDKITGKMLKHAGKGVAECITFILNFTWQHSVLPQRWREANVIPLFKESTSDRGDPNNYRPISLTSIICKLCERLVLFRLWKLVGNQISNRQFGFRSKRSTLDALMFLDHQVRLAFKARKRLPVAFLDISKAFDRTWHTGLLYKLTKLGVTGRPLGWCRAFLSGRRLRTVQDDLTSDWFSFNAGVPQGSVLSPFLFLVFINDVDSRVKGKAMAAMFADDIALIPNNFRRKKKADHDLRSALTKLSCWAIEWRVTFNAKKSHVLCFSTSRKPPSIPAFDLGGEPISRVFEFDYLGLRWQANGQWHAHMNKVLTKASRISGFISATLHNGGPPPIIVRQLCHALIRTKILYGMPVWKPPTLQDWTRLDTIVLEPLRRCLGLPKSTHLQSLLVESHTLSIRKQYDVLAVTACHRALSQKKPHPSRDVIRDQRDWSRTSINPPFSAHARSVCSSLGAPLALSPDKPKMPPRKLLQKQALDQQVLAWRRSDKGKRLKPLVPSPPRIPDYMYHDPRPIAIVRARLRFDRAALAESRRRRGEKLLDILCPICNLPDTIEHLLHECLLAGLPRADMLAAARKAELPTNNASLSRWLLGNTNSLHRKLVQTALDVGGSFLLSVSLTRQL